MLNMKANIKLVMNEGNNSENKKHFFDFLSSNDMIEQFYGFPGFFIDNFLQ